MPDFVADHPGDPGQQLTLLVVDANVVIVCRDERRRSRSSSEVDLVAPPLLWPEVAIGASHRARPGSTSSEVTAARRDAGSRIRAS